MEKHTNERWSKTNRNDIETHSVAGGADGGSSEEVNFQLLVRIVFVPTCRKLVEIVDFRRPFATVGFGRQRGPTGSPRVTVSRFPPRTTQTSSHCCLRVMTSAPGPAVVRIRRRHGHGRFTSICRPTSSSSPPPPCRESASRYKRYRRL